LSSSHESPRNNPRHEAERPVGSVSDRVALFITHANPEDNAFTLWLGAKLEALGYEVWADLMSLHGGDDWQRKLEEKLRRHTRKVLFVGTPHGADKQGVRNEIQIAHDVGREIGDKEFIIPLRLRAFDAPFLIAHAQYIDFEDSWASGLLELLKSLSEGYDVPRTSMRRTMLRDLQLIYVRPVLDAPEKLISNWLALTGLPKLVRFYDFKGGVKVDVARARIMDAPWPTVAHLRGFLSCAPPYDLQEHFGPALPLTIVAECATDDFVETGWAQQRLEPWDARNKFSDLVRQALERFFRSRGLEAFWLSDRKIAWWPPINVVPTKKIRFRWGGLTGARQISGRSKKRALHWHFGLSMGVRTSPVRHARAIGHLIFTEDGLEPFDDSGRAHRMRRSFAKAWRNARWRDMLLAFLYWLANGQDRLVVPMSCEESLTLSLPPMSFLSPIKIAAELPGEFDEDDPAEDELDVDPSELDDAGLYESNPDE
jgi:hypothetical protein